MMSASPARARSLLCGVFVLLGACDPKAGAGDEDGGSGDAGSSTGEPVSGCAAEDRDDDYALGLARDGSKLRVRFVDALPAPPSRGDNTWTLAVEDLATGMPVDDAQLAVEPYMPDHMHGTSIACHVTDMDPPGEVMLEPVNLFMPGLWEVRLHFTLADASTDTVVFRFCVDP
ncbi:MAG: FixH family protein [Deltaproteobacteria bacterium]|nr:FixH family protein [Deltaproteobacteria bacterium]